MPGVKGRSGGWNRKPVEQHVLEGTHRSYRHGPFGRGNLAVLPAPPSPAAGRGPDSLEARRALRALSPASRRLGRALLAEYEGWAPADLTLLRLLLEALDRAEACRRVIAVDGLMPGKGSKRGVHPLLRTERQSRTFAVNALKQLNLEGGK